MERERAEFASAAAVAARDLAAAQAQAARLADQRAAAAAGLRGVEGQVIAASDRLARAMASQAAAERDLRQRAAEMSRLLPLMLRLSRYPAETVLAVPASPDQALEGLLITRGLAAQLNREAAALRTRQDAAASLRAATVREAAALAAERARQAERSASLDLSVAQAASQVTQAEAEGRAAAEQVAAVAARADTLRGAIAAMDAASAAAAAQAAREAVQAATRRQPVAARAARARQAALTRPAGGAAGRMVVPVAGTVQRQFGSPAEDGPATGITYAAAPGGFVASPCAGRVAFAAPFRSFGQLLIVECGGGYDVVLAGLGQIDARPGRSVRAGEPVGRMPAGNGAAARPDLYVELRSRGQPVNPAPFLNGAG